MFAKLCISLLLLDTVASQISGEFWWLNEKIAHMHNIEPPQPVFDDVSELETDESVKILFTDPDVSNEGEIENFQNRTHENLPTALYFKDQSALATPVHVNNVNISDKLIDLNDVFDKNNTKDVINDFNNDNTTISRKSKNIPNPEDILNFSFREDNDLVEINKDTNFNTTNEAKILFRSDRNLEHVESACTFLETFECLKRRGKPHVNGRPIYDEKHLNGQVVCCILPMKTYDLSQIQFPNTRHKHYKRYKRSNSNTESSALKQRNTLLRRKYHSEEINPRLSTTTSRTILTQRIVTPEDYVDPYWNIKNSKFRKSAPKGSEQLSDSGYDSSHHEYADDYTHEIPRPGGLPELYSDNKNKGWALIRPNQEFSYSNSDDESEEDSGLSFGYSTIDPRRDEPLVMSSSRRKPSKLSITSNENMHNAASHVVSFRSKPDFQVLQGFKLLNLAQNKRRFVRTPVQNGVKDCDSETLDIKPSKVVATYMSSTDDEYEDFLDIENQVYKDCGKTYNSFYDTGKTLGEADRGSSPWLTLVVLTRSRQSILCYATLIHPRAAVTAADCVYGTSAGEISVITGAFDLSEENIKSQHRLATVITHPQYKLGKLSHNLAVLHWKKPLVLDRNIQPVCMSDPHVGDECYFIGWGGYDAAIRQRPRWQRAFILPPKSCNVRLNKLDVDLPTDAFCASVDSTSTVTGVGGPLICASNGREAIVGVAVWRDSVILTLPVLEWTARIVEDIVS